MLQTLFMRHGPLVIAGLVLAILVTIGLFFASRRFQRSNLNNAQRLAKNSAVPFITRLLVRGFDFVFAVVLYNTLAGAEIGAYTLGALLVTQYLATFADFGLGVWLTREVARKREDEARLAGMTLLLRLAFMAATIPIALIVVGGYSLAASFGMGEAISPIGQTLIAILLLTLVPSVYSATATALCNAHERMEIPALIELATALLSLIVRLTVVWLGFGVLGIAWSAVFVSCMTALLFALWMRKNVQLKLGWDHALIREILPHAFPLMLNGLLVAVFFRFDTFIIKAFGAGQGDLLVQRYALAYQFLSVPLILTPVITFAVFPMLSRLAHSDRPRMLEVQNAALYTLLLAAVPITVATSILAPDIIVLLTGKRANEYLPISAQILALICWFVPISFTNGLLQYVLIALDRQKIITRAFAFGASFNIIANLIAVPQFGIFGAAVTTILTEAVLLLSIWPTLRREGAAPPLLRLLWRPLLAGLLMGGGMLLLYPFGWFVAAIVGAITYPLLLWLLGGWGENERAFVQRLRTRDTTNI